MKTIMAFELGTMVKDSVSETDGMLTHMVIDMDESTSYIYQPRGLNPKNGAPVDRIQISGARVTGGKLISMDVPMNILGTQAEDIATGFKGKVVSLIYHLNGCLHVNIKPAGVSTDDGATLGAQEFDIRRVKGEKITPMREDELKEDIKKVPSPISIRGVAKY